MSFRGGQMAGEGQPPVGRKPKKHENQYHKLSNVYQPHQLCYVYLYQVTQKSIPV